MDNVKSEEGHRRIAINWLLRELTAVAVLEADSAWGLVEIATSGSLDLG